MEIVRGGASAMAWPREFECPCCHALLRVGTADAQRNADYTGHFLSWFIECPVCREQPDLPESWWSTIERLR